MFFKQKVILISIPKFLSILREKIKNKELYDYMVGKIKEAEASNSIYYLDYDKIEIFNHVDGSMFSITLDNHKSTITTNLSTWNNHRREKRVINFQDNIILIETQESIDISSISTITPSSTTNKSKIEIYEDNSLVFISQKSTITEAFLGEVKSSSSSTEVFINNKRQAMKRIISENNGDFTSPSIAYYYCDSIKTPHWNTLELDIEEDYQAEFTLSNSTAFQSFIDQIDEEEKIFKKI